MYKMSMILNLILKEIDSLRIAGNGEHEIPAQVIELKKNSSIFIIFNNWMCN